MLADTDAGEPKERLAVMAMGTVAYLANRHGDDFALLMNRGAGLDFSFFKSGEVHFERLVRRYETSIGKGSDRDLGDILTYVAENFRRRMIIFIITDMDGESKLNDKLHLTTDTFTFHLFQSVRTICLMLIIWLFALAPSFVQSGEVFGNLVAKPSAFGKYIIFDAIFFESLPREAIIKYGLLILSLIGITTVDYLKYRGINIAERFNKQAFWFRWAILFAMIITIICFGVYGPGYNPADFIYGGF